MTTATGYLLTTEMAAGEAGVLPATIRQWVRRGHLTIAERRGRSTLFRLADVFAAERATRRRAPGAPRQPADHAG